MIAQSATRFPRADHKAKPHPRPTKWRRVERKDEKLMGSEL